MQVKFIMCGSPCFSIMVADIRKPLLAAVLSAPGLLAGLATVVVAGLGQRRTPWLVSALMPESKLMPIPGQNLWPFPKGALRRGQESLIRLSRCLIVTMPWLKSMSYTLRDKASETWLRKAGNLEANLQYRCKILTKQEVYLYKADF